MLTTATGHKAVNACDFWCGDRTNNECEQNGGECLPLTLNGCGESAAPASHDCGRAADIICCVPKPECKPRTCLLHCENGYVVDANGCDTCECLPSSVCEPLTCLLYCERGYAKDAAGCDTCECLE
jgi:hypothetical protein